MTQLTVRIIPITAPVAIMAAALVATPAAAQGAPSGPAGERINQIIVYGDDPCPPAADGEILVCGRMDEQERYRIPEQLRSDPNNPRKQSWTSRVTSMERVGRFGTQSCSPVGLGGYTGCLDQIINDAYAEKAQDAKVDWSKAVAEERARRMQGFDQKAADVEAQVKADEAARIARERAAATAAEGEAPDAEPLPDPTPPKPKG